MKSTNGGRAVKPLTTHVTLLNGATNLKPDLEQSISSLVSLVVAAYLDAGCNVGLDPVKRAKKSSGLLPSTRRPLPIKPKSLERAGACLCISALPPRVQSHQFCPA